MFAESDASFPEGWQSWQILKSGAIPPNSQAIPENLPPIVAETFKTYNWVNNGTGLQYEVLFQPNKKNQYPEYTDGGTAVLHLIDIEALFVTEHFLGEPIYGVYNYDGEDISNAHPSLDTQRCIACHTGYGESCVNGICNKF